MYEKNIVEQLSKIGDEESEQVLGGLTNSAKFVVSSSVMEKLGQQRERESSRQWSAMNDAGANINLGPMWIAKELGLMIFPHTDGRKIGTAHTEGELIILGWIFPGGYVGKIAMIDDKEAAFILLSTGQLQKNGMGSEFPRHSNRCILTTRHGVFAELTQCPKLQLYFLDLRKIIDGYMPKYVKQPGDPKLGPSVLVGGSAGYVQNIKNYDTNRDNSNTTPTVNVNVVQSPSSRRKHIPAHETVFRVWRLHERTNHTDWLIWQS